MKNFFFSLLNRVKLYYHFVQENLIHKILCLAFNKARCEMRVKGKRKIVCYELSAGRISSGE
jgi:hypothetical protein